MAHQRIVELMSVPETDRDLQWLQQSLVSAVQLELATLPPYLTAYWSITSGGTAADLILGITRDEMFHMGQMANILTGTGGTPAINVPGEIPTYPGPLPGGVRPELTVYLAGLSSDWLDAVAMQIEYPEGGPIALFRGECFPTIGSFYDAIQGVITATQPVFDSSKQLKMPIGDDMVKIITTPAEAVAAIEIIKVQGEGTRTSPQAGSSLAHYYEFAEIFHGRTLVFDSTGSWSYSGDPIPFPDVYPVAPIPQDGYPGATGDALKNLTEFNAAYSSLLDLLQAAWVTANPRTLQEAVGAMFSLGGFATALMAIPIPGGTGNYGPTWVYTSSQQK
jgi:hypothetical protein